MAENNPSVVKDASGSNYGGISSDPLAGAQTEYLKGLWDLARTPIKQPLTPDQEFPGLNKSVQVGSMSNQTLGSVPIFGVGGGVISNAGIDSLTKAKQEAEVNYYQSLAVDPKAFDLEVELDNFALRDDWNTKKKSIIDEMYNQALGVFAGEDQAGLKAAKAISVDPDMKRTLKRMDDTARMINASRSKIVEVINSAADPDNNYVSEQRLGQSYDFLDKLDNLEDLSVDEIYKATELFTKNESLYKISENLIADYSEKLVTTFTKAANMDTNKRDAFIKSEITGHRKSDIDNMMESAVAKYSFLKGDTEAQAKIRRELEAQADFNIKKSVEQLVKADTEQQVAFDNLNLKTDENGNPILKDITNPYGVKGTNGFVYPRQKNGSAYRLTTYAGTTMYIKKDGKTLKVTLNDPVEMELRGEYDVQNMNVPNPHITPGRYIDGVITATADAIYDPNVSTTLKEDPKKEGAYKAVDNPIDTKASSQVRPIMAIDVATGQEVPLYGKISGMVSWDEYSNDVSTNIPGVNTVHSKMTRTDNSGGYANPIELTDETPDVKIDPNKYYKYNGTIYKGSQIK